MSNRSLPPQLPAQPFNVTTPHLGLNKPLPGGDDDIWGDLLNDNADVLDAAIHALQQLTGTIDCGEF